MNRRIASLIFLTACSGDADRMVADDAGARDATVSSDASVGDAADVADAAPVVDGGGVPVQDSGPTACALPALWMPVDCMRGRDDVELGMDGDSIASGQAQIIPFAMGVAPTNWVNVAYIGKTMATMDQDFAGPADGGPSLRAAILASGAKVKLVATNGGINDMRAHNGDLQVEAATCAHLASWCAQVRDAGAKSIVMELQPVCPKILLIPTQEAYVACEDGLVEAGTCDYLVPRDMALVSDAGDGGYDPAILSDCLHPTPEGAYRIVSHYARLVAGLVDAGAP